MLNLGPEFLTLMLNVSVTNPVITSTSYNFFSLVTIRLRDISSNFLPTEKKPLAFVHRGDFSLLLFNGGYSGHYTDGIDVSFQDRKHSQNKILLFLNLTIAENPSNNTLLHY